MNDSYKDFISPTKWKIYYNTTYHIKDIYYCLWETIRRVIKDSMTKKLYGERNSEISLVQQKKKDYKTKNKNNVIINCLVTRKYFNTGSS